MRMNNIMKAFIFIALLALSGCESTTSGCYTQQLPGTTDYQDFTVRADGILVNGSASGNPMAEIPESDIDPITGFIKSGNFGKWQKITRIDAGIPYVLKVTGEIYLKRTENFATILPGKLIANYDDGTPMRVSEGDLLLITMVKDDAVPFKAIGGFNSSYIDQMSSGKPASGTPFFDYYNSYFSNPSNTEQAFIDKFGYCDIGTNKLKNCFNKTGRGLVFKINNTDYSSNITDYGFISTRSSVPSQANPDSYNAITTQIRVSESGNLSIYIDNSRFADSNPSKEIVGGYKLKIIHVTDRRTNGNSLTGYIVDNSIDMNNPNRPALNAQNAARLGFYNTVTQIEPLPKPGTLWLKVTSRDDIDKDDEDYSDNMGEYYISVSKEVSGNTIQSMYTDFVVPMKNISYLATTQMFDRTVTDQRFQKMVKVASVLTVIIYGIAFILGMVREPQMEFVQKIIKISLLSILISDQSWNFFSENMFGLFTFGPEALITAAIGGGNSNPFGILDKLLFAFTGDYLGVKIASLLLYGVFGILCIAVLLITVMFLFLACIKIVLIYTIMMMASAFLIALAPIFLIAILFKQTFKYFDEWLKMLIYTSFQPAILMICVGVIGYIAMALGGSLFSDRICWSPYLKLIWEVGVIKHSEGVIYWFMPDFMTVTDLIFSTSRGIVGPDKLASDTFYNGLKGLIGTTMFGLGVYILFEIIPYSEKLAAVLFGDAKFKSGVSKNIDSQVDGIVDAITGGLESIKNSFKQAKKDAEGSK